MPPRAPERTRERIRERIARIQDQIRALDYVCSGTLLRRMMTCGKPSCRCAQDPAARHGPYFEWGRMQGGKLVHNLVPPHQAKILKRAIANYRRIRALLRAWEAQTMRLMKAEKPSK